MFTEFQAFDDFAIEVEDSLKINKVDVEDHQGVQEVIQKVWTSTFGDLRLLVIVTRVNVTLALVAALYGEDAFLEDAAATILYGNYAYHLVVPNRETFVKSHPSHATKH